MRPSPWHPPILRRLVPMTEPSSTAGAETVEPLAPTRSFDVFDTVLTRRVGAPAAVADVLGKRLAQQGTIPVAAPVFAASRRRFETHLTGLLGRHASLREIHRAVAEGLSLGPQEAE